ncbi:DNA-3-methyladenine glycosylase [Methylophaga frappieri]|uniref:DNA-3-methyladenine glycosylase n=2 Tax=Methylophaga frappieri (strain ATCC BAA-2434 / DSM 25690 / JAM7) TaxID=754477 RepID=I1YKQ6_METFJ|nr:DNA-3-methyladenine glycosylase [Methylophaga frappieri]
MFEFLLLETFQAGLSWITILRKRENFRKAFDNFDYTKIAEYDQSKIDALLKNKGIIRNKLKVYSAIVNARAFMAIQQEFGSFTHYIWGFVNHAPIQNQWQHEQAIPATSKQSDALSQDLKKRGFKFVGSTVIYALMQATGMINDHVESCFRYNAV